MTLQEFIQKYTNQFVEYHSYDPAAKNQCVDLANQWLVEGLGLEAIIGTNAIDFPSKAVARGMDWIPNTPDGIPEPGDLIVYEGTIGHIDIALEGCTKDKVVAFSQNYPTGSPCVVRTGTYLRPKAVGWLHHETSDVLTVCLQQHTELVTKCNTLEETIKNNQKILEDTQSDLAELQIRLEATNANYQSLIESDKQFFTNLEASLGIVTKKEDTRDDREKAVMAAVSDLRQSLLTEQSNALSIQDECIESLGLNETTENEIEYLAIKLKECQCQNEKPWYEQLFGLCVQLFHKSQP